jgi:hypothetical protein
MERVTNKQRSEGMWCWWRKEDVMVGMMRMDIGSALKEGVGYKKKDKIEN